MRGVTCLTVWWVDCWFFLDVFLPFCSPCFLVQATVPTGPAVVTLVSLGAGLLVVFVVFVNEGGETTFLSFSLSQARMFLKNACPTILSQQFCRDPSSTFESLGIHLFDFGETIGIPRLFD